MQFLPEDIENIILDYKKQFERKYNCGIKHEHIFKEKTYKKNIIFYKNPYKFECKICKYKICNEHSDEFIKKHTRKKLCVNCHMTEVQMKKILNEINNKDVLIKYLRTYKSMLFFFKDENLEEINNLLKKENKEITENILYDIINKVYNKLEFFDFFQTEI